MGLFDLFHKKKNETSVKDEQYDRQINDMLKNVPNHVGEFDSNKVQSTPDISKAVSNSFGQNKDSNRPYPVVGYPSKNGLYLNEEEVLRLAPAFYVGQTDISTTLLNNYDVGFAYEITRHLEKEGYLRQENSAEALQHLKVTELRSIAKELSITVKGKKADICKQLSDNALPGQFDKYIQKRYWVITDKGQQEINDNQYLDILFDKHEYYMGDLGIDAKFLNQQDHDHPKMKIRDIIWGNLNKQSMKAYRESAKTGYFHEYAQVKRTMALFVEEEGSSYTNALDLYLEYLFYKINFQAFFSGMTFYQTSHDLDSASESGYMSAKLYPFEIKDLTRLKDECEFDLAQFKDFMGTSLSRITDKGPLSNGELIEFIIDEMAGNTTVSQAYFKSGMQRGDYTGKKY